MKQKLMDFLAIAGLGAIVGILIFAAFYANYLVALYLACSKGGC